MENRQTALAIPLLQFLEQPVVVTVQRCVALIEETAAEGRVGEEETAAEIIDGLLRVGQELIGKERHVIARPTEHLGEERLVAPHPAVADSPEREHVLEDKAREIPRRDNIGERNK